MTPREPPLPTPTQPAAVLDRLRRWAPVLAPALGLALILGVVAIIAARGGASAGGGAGAPQAVSIAQVFFVQMNPETGRLEVLGSLIIWLLIAISVVSLALMGSRAWENRRDAIVPERRVRHARRLVREGRIPEIKDELKDQTTDFAQVLRAALAELPHGFGAMLRAGERTADDLVVRRLRRLETLAVIGNVAPMIGLFGTVYGIILAFQEVVASGGTPDPVGLASGIGTALVTTFWGLVVAIPALTAHGLLRTRVDGLSAHAARSVEDVLAALRPAPGAGDAVAPAQRGVGWTGTLGAGTAGGSGTR